MITKAFNLKFSTSEDKEETAFADTILASENEELKIENTSLKEQLKVVSDRELNYKTEIERLKSK